MTSTLISKMRDLYSATISFDSDTKILTVKFKDGVDVDVEEMKELVSVSLEMVDNKPFYLFVDARDILSSMDHEARKYISEHKHYNDLNIAQAIVVNNIPIRLLAGAYFKLYKHVNPIKIFNSVIDARQWLLSN